MDRLTIALLALGAMFLGLLVIVASNDAGGTTEIRLLQGAPSVATDSECDAMYHAIWRVHGEPSHTTLINITKSMGCPY